MEAIVKYFKALSQDSPGETEEVQVKSQKDI